MLFEVWLSLETLSELMSAGQVECVAASSASRGNLFPFGNSVLYPSGGCKSVLLQRAGGRLKDAHSKSWTLWSLWVHSNSKYSVNSLKWIVWVWVQVLIVWKPVFHPLVHHWPLHPSSLALSLPLNCWECSSKLLFWFSLISPLKMSVWKRVVGTGAFFIILGSIFYRRVNFFVSLWSQKASELVFLF